MLGLCKARRWEPGPRRATYAVASGQRIVSCGLNTDAGGPGFLADPGPFPGCPNPWSEVMSAKDKAQPKAPAILQAGQRVSRIDSEELGTVVEANGAV